MPPDAPTPDPAAMAAFDVLRWESATGAHPERKSVIVEAPVSLYVNRFELVTWMCTPVNLERLALGFLLNERVIASRDEVRDLRLREEPAEGRRFVDVQLVREDPPLPRRRILTAGCVGGVTFDDVVGREERVESAASVAAEAVPAALQALNAAAKLYQETRGVHTSALVGEGGALLAVEEDVGRHNTLDKIRGACALEGIEPRDRMLVSTGRISSEMLSKAARMRCPIVASRTSPTALSVKLARAWGIGVAGYVRRDGFTVYAHPERFRM